MYLCLQSTSEFESMTKERFATNVAIVVSVKQVDQVFSLHLRGSGPRMLLFSSVIKQSWPCDQEISEECKRHVFDDF